MCMDNNALGSKFGVLQNGIKAQGYDPVDF